MRKPRLIQSYYRLLKERNRLLKEKEWLIKNIESFTYDGMQVAPRGVPLGATWEEAATYSCLSEEEKKHFKFKRYLSIIEGFEGL